MKRLVVAIYGQPAGTIERAGGRLELRYLPSYLSSDNPTPLSLSMPLSSSTYATRPIEAYLKGLLPDNADVRQRWALDAGVRA